MADRLADHEVPSSVLLQMLLLEGGEGNRWKFAFAASEAESRFPDLQEWGSSHLSLAKRN